MGLLASVISGVPNRERTACASRAVLEQAGTSAPRRWEAVMRRRSTLEGRRRDVNLPEVAMIEAVIGSISNTGMEGPLGAAPALRLTPLRVTTSQGPLHSRRIGVVRPKRVRPRAVESSTSALASLVAVVLSCVALLLITPRAQVAMGGGELDATLFDVVSLLSRFLMWLLARRADSGTQVAELDLPMLVDAVCGWAPGLAGQLPSHGNSRGRNRLAGYICRTSA